MESSKIETTLLQVEKQRGGGERGEQELVTPPHTYTMIVTGNGTE